MLITFFEQHYNIMLIYLMFMGFLSGFIDAIAGGGGLIGLPALMVTGLPMADILGTNKFQASIGTATAVYKYYRSDLINFKTVYQGLLVGFLGAVLGAITVNYISNSFMEFVVPFLLLIVLLFNIFNKNLGVVAGIKRMDEKIFFPLFGFILGFYDAFFGPGTGNFWIIAIVFFLGYTFLNASGYAKVLNLKSNLFSLFVFLYYGHVNFLLGAVMAVGQFIGGYVGAHAVILKGSKLVRPFFLTVVSINVLMTFITLIKHYF